MKTIKLPWKSWFCCWLLVTTPLVASAAFSCSYLFEEIHNDLSFSNPNLQYSIWQTSLRNRIRSDQMTKAVVYELEYGKIIKTERIAAQDATGVVLLVTFESGLKAIWKGKKIFGQRVFTNPEKEVAAFKVDQILGFNLVPITTMRKMGLRNGSIQLYIENHEYQQSLTDYVKIIIFDYIIGNWDRSEYNLLYAPNGSHVAIDNGVSLNVARWKTFFNDRELGHETNYNHMRVQIPQTYMQALQSLYDQQSRIYANLEPYVDEDEIFGLILRVREVLQQNQNR